MDSPPGPPHRTANQNHSARMGTRRAPSCSQRPPGDLTWCQTSLVAPPSPPHPYHPRGHPQRAIGSPQLNEASMCCSLAAHRRAVALNKAPHRAFAGRPLGTGHPAKQCISFRAGQASGVDQLRLRNPETQTGSSSTTSSPMALGKCLSLSLSVPSVLWGKGSVL